METQAALEARSTGASEFRVQGYVGPIDVLTSSQCATLARYFDQQPRAKPERWVKGLAASDRLVYEIATQPALLTPVVGLLGPDVILWGASIVDRAPGEHHPWHTDIETSAPDVRTVTAWIGLENTCAESCVNLIPGSHLYGVTLQEAALARGIPRDARTAATALECARERAPGAGLHVPDAGDGQAILFDGRIWHGTLNGRPSGRRRALLLQYASADTRIRIPDWSHLDPPFVLKDEPRPPVLLVAGSAPPEFNDLVEPPTRSPEKLPPLRSLVRKLPWPLPDDPRRGWRPFSIFRGTTPVVNQLGCHVSVLNPGRSPHLPHSHLDEEILIVLDGRAQVVIAEPPQDPAPRIEEFEAGDFIYYPAFQHHTIRCIGERPVTCLMLRWHALPGARAQDSMDVTVHRARDYEAPELKPRTIRTSLLFEGPTAHCAKLHFHRTRVNDGGGYAAHVDEHDVAIVLLRGKVRTLGRTVRAPAVVHYPAGEMHGLRGVGTTPAEYLVVEFHRDDAAMPGSPPGEVAGTAVHRRRVELEYRLRAARTAVEQRLQMLRRALGRGAPPVTG